MLDVYAAWIEGAKESDIEAIRQALESSPRAMRGTLTATALNSVPAGPHQSPEFGTDMALDHPQDGVSKRMRWEMYGGKGGTRTLDPGIMSAVL